MSFKPIYWYYGNTKFSSEEIDEFKSNIDKIGAEKYTKDNVISSITKICKKDVQNIKERKQE